MRDFLLQQNDYRSLRKETSVAMMRLIVYHPSSCTDLASKRKLWIWVGGTLGPYPDQRDVGQALKSDQEKMWLM